MEIGLSYNYFQKIIQNRWIHHLLFWMISFYILLNMFASSNKVLKVDYIYTFIFILTLFLAVYINLFILIPKLLNPKKVMLFSLLFIGLLLSSTLFNIVLFDHLIDYILPGYYFISYYSFIDVLKFFMVFLFSTTLLKLSKEWFYLVGAKQKLVEMEREKAEVELKALRSQINPHFLFNSLNVLYFLALKRSGDSPDAIIKLSDVLRHVIYGSNKDKVKLSAEVKLIEDYLSLQQYRIDFTSRVTFEKEIETDIDIAPMLFLPLVENSFKHGIKGNISESYVNIFLKVKNGKLLFKIENNKGKAEEIENPPPNGIGINNIKHRLELLYANQHALAIEESEKVFKVTLSLDYEN